MFLRITFILYGLMSLFLAPSAMAADIHKDIRIAVQKSQSGKWVVDIAFPRTQSAMVFAYSAGGHHVKSWKPISEGAQIKTIKGLDVLVFDQPSRTARFTLEPQDFRPGRRLIPARAFNDGNIAFFTGEFLMLPVISEGAAAKLNGNIRNWRGTPLKHTLLALAPDQNILINGERFSGVAKLSFNSIGAGYIFIGDNDFVETKHYKAIIDKTMPQWLRTRFEADYERVLSRLTQLWGRGLDEKPTILFNVANFNAGPYRYSGLESGGHQLVMQIGGKAFLTPSEDLIRKVNELIAHETTHLFQGQNGVRSSTDVAWILEGAANVMARDVLFKEGLITESQVQERYNESYGNCLKTIRGGLSTQRGRFYDCGEIMALIADKAMGQKTLYDAWNVILKKSKNKDFESRRYFTTLRALGASRSSVSMLEDIAKEKLEAATIKNMGIDHRDTLKQLMVEVGLNPQFDAKGALTRFDWQ